MTGTVSVDFPQPPHAVFAFLADPRTRPRWQSSLRRVEFLSEARSGVGTRWIDVTTAGVRPVMEVTVSEPDRVWAERGTWRGIEAVVTMRFTPTSPGTRVEVDVDLGGAAWLRPVHWVLAGLAPLALRSDLRRAARVLPG